MTPYWYQLPVIAAMQASLSKGCSHLDTSDTGTGKTLMACKASAPFGRIGIIAPISVHNQWIETMEAVGGKVAFIGNVEAIKQATELIVRTGKRLRWNPEHTGDLDVVVVDECHRFSAIDSANAEILWSFPGRVIMLSASPADSILKTKALCSQLGLCPHAAFWYWVQKRFKARKGFFGGLQISHRNNLKAMAWLREKLTAKGQLTGIRKAALPAGTFPELAVETRLLDVPDPEELETEYQKDLLKLRDSAEDLDQAGVVFLRSRQFAESAMVEQVKELAEDLLESGNSVIVFACFRETIRELGFPQYAGDIPADVRATTLATFNAKPKQTLGMSIGCGSESLSAHDTRGDSPRVAIILPGAKALEVIQATGRIHRSGGKSFARAIIVFPNCKSGRRIRSLVKSKTQRIETLTNADLL